MKKLTIIGGGPAGYAAALYANNFDLEVTLIESDILGGTCLNRGCIPAKYWLHLAELNHEINNASDYGIQIENSEIDWNKSALKRQGIISGLVNGIGALLKSKKVTVINGWGKIENEHSVLIKKEDGSELSLETDYILLATGSKPRELPSLQFDNEFIISSDSALNWEKPPKNVCIVGAGAIGCEFASALIDLGSNVTVVELEKEILPGLDKRTSGELRKQLTKRGVVFRMGTSIDSVTGREALFSDGEKQSFDSILVAIGRSPLTENIGLEDISVITKNGYIDVNLETMQIIGTESVFAAGDIISNSPQLAHVAFAEAISAVTYIATGNPSPINYSAIPYVVYTLSLIHI